MWHVFRRTPHAFPARSPATPPESLPDGLVLQLLPSAHQPRRQAGAHRAAREPHRKRDELFSNPSAARPFSEGGSRGSLEEETGTPRLVVAGMERRLFNGPGALHARDYGLRCACLLLPAESASIRDAHTQTSDSSAVEGGNRGFGHQLFRAAYGAARRLHRSADGAGGLHLPAALLREDGRQVFGQAGAERNDSVRFSQLENGIPAPAQRHDFLPQRDDLFRRSRAKAADREVSPVSQSRRVSLRRARGKSFRTNNQVQNDPRKQRHRLSANRGSAVTFSPDDRSSELRDLFFESAEEIVQNMNEAGLGLESHPKDPEKLRSVRRAVHTLKGDSAACGFRQLSELAHELEDVLVPELAEEN